MDKRKELNRHKLFATFLFLLMAVIYILCAAVFKTGAWIGYVQAFAEAGMVGALADWFAVVALFRHPLGIPIPHTDLIESSKKKIGNNLGSFVTDNFLTADAIRPRLKKLEIASKLGQWLLSEKNRHIVITELTRIIKEAISKFNDEDITRIIYAQVQSLVDNMPLQKIAGEGLAKAVNDNMHQDWITTLTTYLGKFLYNNKELVKQKVKDESHFLIPGFVDKMIAEKITNAGIRYMEEIANDPGHPVRQKLGDQLSRIAEDIQNDGLWAKRLTTLKDEFLSAEHLQQYSGTAWQYIKKNIEEDLDKPTSAISAYINKMLEDMGNSLAHDLARQKKIDSFIQVQAFKLLMKYKHNAGEMISQTVTNWPSRQLSEKLELEVGKDLQFIRINGTLVGGTVGLLIYTLTKLFS